MRILLVASLSVITVASAASVLDGVIDDELPIVGAASTAHGGEGQCAPANQDWPTYRSYIGAMHEHTGYSDGAPGTTPADAFAQIRARGLDFAASGEHSDNAHVPVAFTEGCFKDPLACPQPPPEGLMKWEATRTQASAASDDAFVAFRGFEWTSDRFGHINVYFSRNDANARLDGGHATMDAFWQWFTRHGAGGGADGLATFNHPGREALLTTADPGFNWNDFAYVPAADPRMVGIEVFNRGTDYGTLRDNVPAGHPGWYAYALDKGWHLGPIGAEDEHNREWGTPARAKTVLIARELTAPALREALFARRFYAVGPNRNDLRLAFTIDGEPMGARLARSAGQKLRLHAEVTEGAFDGRIEIVASGGRVVAQTGGRWLQRWVRVTDDGREQWYFVRVVDKTGMPIAYSAPIWVRSGGPYAVCGEWIAGDLHVHTTYSHDSWGGPDTPDEVPEPLSTAVRSLIPGDDNTDVDEAYTLGHTVERQFLIAAARGLDYLAISDHNDIRSQTDPGFGAHGVIPIPSYENSLKGHAQMHGARRLYDRGRQDQASVQAMADALRGDGGVFQVNHPAEGSVRWPADADWEMARSATGTPNYDGDVVPDLVEVWNIAWLWQPPMPSASSNDDALRYWEGWLDRGERVGASGGSDSHWASTAAIQGVGQPTTWVFVTERTERAVLAALKAGRTTLSHQPPLLNSPRVLLQGDADGDGRFEAMVGDAVPRAASLRASVLDGAGAELRIVGGGRVVQVPIPAFAHVFEHDFTAPPGARWVRAEVVHPDAAASRAAVCDEPFGTRSTYCRNRVAVLALSSALYLE